MARNLAIIAFIGAYFATIVLGNLVYATSFGESLLDAAGYPTAFLEFKTTFTVGYWLLLLAPLIVIPVALAVRKVAQRPIDWASEFAVDIPPALYAALSMLLYALVLYSFWRADVVALFTEAQDEISSVEARFEILDRIGFVTLVILQALLPFMTIYGLVRALKNGGIFWILVTVFNVVALTFLLILLNMKWPVLLLQIGLIMTVFVHSRRWAYLLPAIGIALMIPLYLAISTIVFRIAPQESAAIMQESNVPKAPENQSAESVERNVNKSLGALPMIALQKAPVLLAHGVNRMAVTYPYYYRIFTEEGPICGNWFDQLQRGQKCRPSWVVYSRIFPDDGFTGRGTAGTSVNISGYAVGGWVPAVSLMLLASLILGLFISLPVDKSALSGALVITGGLTGYYISQLPLEGVLVYSNGIIWTGMLVLVLIAIGQITQLKRRMYKSRI